MSSKGVGPLNILSSKRDLNKRQSIHSVSVFNKPIYRYTYQTRINKSKSAMTNENLLYYLSKKKELIGTHSYFCTRMGYYFFLPALTKIVSVHITFYFFIVVINI